MVAQRLMHHDDGNSLTTIVDPYGEVNIRYSCIPFSLPPSFGGVGLRSILVLADSSSDSSGKACTLDSIAENLESF